MIRATSYISGAGSPGVTLQTTLMNHTNTVKSVAQHLDEYSRIFPSGSSIKQILGEHNSLYNQGKPGLSNSFGAALWGVDFNMHCAASDIKRVHMHMGTNFRYASWQPIDTHIAVKGTKAPYYGNIAVASALGDTSQHDISVAGLELQGDEREAAYAVYADDKLARILIINMNGYNTTVDGTGLGVVAQPLPRGSRNYTFALDSSRDTVKVGVQRLMANGSDAISGITWDGWSYNYELDKGRPVRLANVTVGETLAVHNGVVTVTVPDSSAALLNIWSSSPDK